MEDYKQEMTSHTREFRVMRRSLGEIMNGVKMDFSKLCFGDNIMQPVG